jgi:hypothetical protein
MDFDAMIQAINTLLSKEHPDTFVAQILKASPLLPVYLENVRTDFRAVEGPVTGPWNGSSNGDGLQYRCSLVSYTETILTETALEDMAICYTSYFAAEPIRPAHCGSD